MLWRLFRKRRVVTNQQRIEDLRRRGVRIGEGCSILSSEFSTEPYLVELGDNVIIAGGVRFITHNGLAAMLRHKHPNMQVFGRIRVGSGSFVGLHAILLHDADIGRDCIIGAGSVVRGVIPDNSVAAGNPARVLGRTSDALRLLVDHPHRLDVFNTPAAERRRIIEEHFHLI